MQKKTEIFLNVHFTKDDALNTGNFANIGGRIYSRFVQ